ncbi:hypothetical protein D039_2915A, partial [Vibrio parahaemolyticus EKP-028]
MSKQGSLAFTKPCSSG